MDSCSSVLSDWPGLTPLLPPGSDKSKRRTKTVKKSVEPRWNQTFMYSPVHQREFRERTLELTVWDQARVREEESQFLGQVRTTPRLDHLDVLMPQNFQQLQNLHQLLEVLELLDLLEFQEHPEVQKLQNVLQLQKFWNI